MCWLLRESPPKGSIRCSGFLELERDALWLPSLFKMSTYQAAAIYLFCRLLYSQRHLECHVRVTPVMHLFTGAYLIGAAYGLHYASRILRPSLPLWGRLSAKLAHRNISVMVSAQNTSSATPTALFNAPFTRWAYRCVISIVECPRSSLSMYISTLPELAK